MYELKIYVDVMCHDNEEWCKIGRGIDFSKLAWEISQILTGALESLKYLHFNGLFLIKVYNVWARKSAEELCLMALKIDANVEGKLTCAFKNDMKNLASFHRLKNSDFILKVKWKN